MGIRTHTANLITGYKHNMETLSPDELEQTAKTPENDYQRHIVSSEEPLINPYHYDLPRHYRWTVLIASIILCIFTGPAFLNWPPFDNIFHAANAYSHLCDENDPTYKLRESNEIYCDEKKRQISSMLPAAIGAMFGVDLGAGILLDCFGGKICTFVGLILQLLGYVMIGASGSGFVGYKFGIVLIGLGIDPTFFGKLMFKE